jgi:hypothetical protein
MILNLIFFDELDGSSDLAQSPPEEVEQIEEEVDEADIREYLAMQAGRDSALVEELGRGRYC